MNEDEKVFRDVSELLHQHNVNFWICHGTLLGIVREGRLLPWDHDMDFAVWDSETSKEKIIDIFLSNGYKQELVFGDMDCLHFYGVNKKVDISFYKVRDGIASIKWVAPTGSILLRSYLYCVQVIWEESSKNIELSNNLVKKLVQIALIKVLFIFKNLLNSKLRQMLYAKAIKLMNFTGYNYPHRLMVFKKIKFNDVLIQIPVDSEECLKLTYGEDWKTPKKNYIWYEEATNLTK